MIDILTPVIRAFWEEGIPPDIWNQGIITNVFKGKGDREDMANQRGITVSSSIGTIVEEILTNRLLKTIKFSQAQAGGRKGGNALDHIFILKSEIEEALKEGQGNNSFVHNKAGYAATKVRVGRGHISGQ